jgi:hypothetical protein
MGERTERRVPHLAHSRAPGVASALHDGQVAGIVGSDGGCSLIAVGGSRDRSSQWTTPG